MPKQLYYMVLMPRQSCGLIHNLARLKKSVQEAVCGKRILILPPAFLGHKHNPNGTNHKQIYDYLSFDDTGITIEGRRQALDYVHVNELDRKDMAKWTVKCLLPHEAIKADETADLVARFERAPDCSPACFVPTQQRHQPQSFLRNKEGRKVRVGFAPARVYRQLAEQVVDALGGEKCYYALHVRRGDLVLRSPQLSRATRPGSIIKRVQSIVPEGATLYVLSDEKDKNYFEPLKKHWRIARYHDFRALNRMVDSSNPFLVDNYGLFLVEGLVYWRAKIKIATYPEHGIRIFGDFFDGRGDRQNQGSLLAKKPKGANTTYYFQGTGEDG